MVPQSKELPSIGGVLLDSPALQADERARMVRLEKRYSHNPNGLSVEVRKSIKVTADDLGFVSLFVCKELQEANISVEDARHFARVLLSAADEAEAAAFRKAGYVKAETGAAETSADIRFE